MSNPASAVKGEAADIVRRWSEWIDTASDDMECDDRAAGRRLLHRDRDTVLMSLAPTEITDEMVSRASQAIGEAGRAWLNDKDPTRTRLSWSDIPDEVFARAALSTIIGK